MENAKALERLRKSIPGEEDFQCSHTPIDKGKYYRSSYELNRSKVLAALIPDGQCGEALDVGAGSGHFSQILKRKGWATTAVDSDPQNAESLKNCSDRAILGDALSALSTLTQDRYGLVLALEIIEHMPRSEGQKLIEKIKRVLKPKGRLILSTPNRFSLEGFGGYYFGEKIRKKKWFAWDQTHVCIYSSREIIRILRGAGFAVNKVIGYWYNMRLPFGARLTLLLQSTRLFPLNRLGFNIILECSKES